ncbi:hypothetical protein Q91_1334 [Cycloclasticus sp. P1]|nr:hypothetical protein Q91_1334 [Cycloclasticus sp. P1]
MPAVAAGVIFKTETMKKLLSLIFLMFLFVWFVYILYLTGYIPEEQIPDKFTQLELPKTTAELGDSLALIDSLFASVALVLGLVAILIQGKELKASTKAQTSQAKTLELQIKQQQDSNLLGAYSVRQTFLLSDCERLNNQIESLVSQELKETNTEKKSELWKLIKNSRNKERKQREESKKIDANIENLLNKI